MFPIVSALLVNLFCSFYQCELSLYPPFLIPNPQDNRIFPRERLLSLPASRANIHRQGVPFDEENPNVVLTKLGLVQGFKMGISETREIFAFTGVPYGETTGGENRFRAPVPKKPWEGIWDATFPSSMCLQFTPLAGGQDLIRGKEDCLQLDIYTPKIPKNGSEDSLLPVFMFVPGGSFWFGDSRTFGPKYLLRENVILIIINVRMEIFGWLGTGDEHASGNWGLKDQALAIEWVHDNIKAFGGDPNKIIIGGMSSSAATAHMMLFTNHKSRNYVKGIICFSGVTLIATLDVHGSVRELSDAAAATVGCPTSREGEGGSKKMVECLRKIPAYVLVNFQRVASALLSLPPHMFLPTLEPPGPSAFISEPPEVQYSKGSVPPIPLIITRAESELEMGLVPLRPNLALMTPHYFRLMPLVLHLGYRNTLSKVNASVAQVSYRKIHQLYFGKSTAPNFVIGSDISNFCQMMNDAFMTAPMWKSIEYHHKIAPTYAYIMKTKTFAHLPIPRFARRALTQYGAGHGSDLGLLFNINNVLPPLTPGSDSDRASRRLINMIVNFADHGAPLYRNGEGKLLNLWKPVEDIHNPIALEVGLVNEIKMIVDPIAASGRLRIWEEVVF
ncbi:unnamed protein product [Orchesella dallaii]|uniref:Carboxylesterase type B domain-containing protein n=1 Tax=Orchesella dallaii TaxID=48710 RepID=A0ABP1RS32_9HEXA